ncbi:MAG: GHKL domain-containing protein [Planctomycetales bacterium]|nr:GHKL domain-containing protein [Planctomycetales bacterium]
MNLSVSLITADGGKRTFIAIVRDISDRKFATLKAEERSEELEERVTERTRELLAANEELESFSYSVSHDLRAPIRHIIGFSRILQKQLGSDLPDTAANSLQTIQDSANHAGNLIDALLALSRAGRAELNYEAIDLNQMIETICKSLQANSENANVHFEIADMPDIRGDSTLLDAAFVNLLENAVKFSSKVDDPKVQITAEGHEGNTIIAIKDNGVGFDMKYSDQLFGAFQRLHDQREFPGTGIGLALVKRIVKRHAGSICAESKPGEGATFFVSLPNRS